MKFIAGLGNVGQQYVRTRHNIGFRILDALAEKYALRWTKSVSHKGELVTGSIKDHKVCLIKPSTYMNDSGICVKSVMRYYKGDSSELTVVTDDVALPLGTIRFRTEGSSGGHNGLKDIEARMGTQQFSRFRVGVGDREHGSLSDHVLGTFTAKEEELLPHVIDLCVEHIEEWLSLTLGETTWHVN